MDRTEMKDIRRARSEGCIGAIPQHPIKLRRYLDGVGISQKEFGTRVLQAGGKPMGKALVSLMLGRGVMPRSTPAIDIDRQARSLLRERNSPFADASDLFDFDEVYSPGKSAAPVVSPVTLDEPLNLEPVMLTQAAKKAFGLFTNPFVDDVQGPDDVFLSADQRYVRAAFREACKRGGYFIAVVGESGSGKSTLRRDTLDYVRKEDLPVTIIMPEIVDKTHLNARHLCEAILADISPNEKPGRSLERIARQVREILQSSSRAGQTHVLMIEEAHDLPISTLKYLKRFWEIEDGFTKLLSIVLIGQPELKDKLDARRYFEAREVINRCEVVELLPLDSVLGDYLTLKFKRIDRALDSIFDAGAVDAIRMRLTIQRRNGVESQVYPLLVNNLVVRALNEAASLGAPRITADIVRSC